MFFKLNTILQYHRLILHPNPDQNLKIVVRTEHNAQMCIEIVVVGWLYTVIGR